jgi:nucleoid DNA-binding protein
MEKKVITKAILAKELKQSGLSFDSAVECIDTLFESMTDALSQGERIELRGFGSFQVVKRAARTANLNGRITIPEHANVKFLPGRQLRKAVWNSAKRKK